MKHWQLLRWLLVLAALAGPLAAVACRLPPDSLAGQTRLVRRMSTAMCEQLAQEVSPTGLSQLTGEASMALFGRLMLGAMSSQQEEYHRFLALNKEAAQAEGFAQHFATALVLELAQRCPPARSLLMRAGLQQMGHEVTLAPAERAALLPVARQMCEQFEAENVRQPLAGRTPAERKTVLTTIMLRVLDLNQEELADHYGTEALADEEQMRRIGERLGVLAFELCPHSLLLLGQDALRDSPDAPAQPEPEEEPAGSRDERTGR